MHSRSFKQSIERLQLIQNTTRVLSPSQIFEHARITLLAHNAMQNNIQNTVSSLYSNIKVP